MTYHTGTRSVCNNLW